MKNKQSSMLPTKISKSTPGSVKGMQKRVFGAPKIGNKALTVPSTIKAPKIKPIKMPK